jgi:adenylyl-sulfate kinase
VEPDSDIGAPGRERIKVESMEWHNGKTIWFTGLSGSGKSTISVMLKSILESRGVPVVLLDGDVLRSGLNRDLGFSPIDRAENIRRAAEVARILSDAGHTVISAFITPTEILRKAVRGRFEPSRFVEIFLDCSLEVCERRDTKGLYRKARCGQLAEFTGISSPFERPAAAELDVPTDRQALEESVDLVLSFLESRFSDLSPHCCIAPGIVGLRGRRRVAVIGLDGVPASLVFGDAGWELPNLRGLMEHGTWGPLRSTDPPITIPAWTTITTGRDPGELGIYGFRNRAGYDYREMIVVHSGHVRARRVWEYVEETGRTSCLLGVPQTYPPRAHSGITVAGFPEGDGAGPLTFPAGLAEELNGLAEGEYLSDVRDFRTVDKRELLGAIKTMMDRRFRVARDFLLHRSWDFFMMVEMAPDRMHHGFWRYGDRDHPLHEPGNPYANVMRDFYLDLDQRLGSLLMLLDDDTTVLVVSDHGAQGLVGGVCINEWLIENGYLTLHRYPEEETPLTADLIDWSRTKVWSEGGYYARIFFNVRCREPQGIVDAAEYHELRNELAVKFAAMPDGNGGFMVNRVLKPEEVYAECNGVAPDLIVYFDDLKRRSVGTVGRRVLHVQPDHGGLDDANHHPDGIFIATRMADLRRGQKRDVRLVAASCLDVTPTILQEFGLRVNDGLRGRVISLNGQEPPRTIALGPTPQRRGRFHSGHAETDFEKGYTESEEQVVLQRLKELGYI